MKKNEVKESEYDREYFEHVCDGWREFEKGEIGERLKKAVSFAGNDFSGKKVLDIGFGRGELLIYLAKRGAICFGIDYSTASIQIAAEAAEKNKVKVEFTQKSVTEMDFPENFFDAVFMLDVVEHLTDEQLAVCFESVRKSLSPNGVFVVHTMPNRFLALPFYWVSNITKSQRGINEKVHINEQTPGSLRKKLHAFDTRISLAHQPNYFKNTVFYATHKKFIRPFVDVFLCHDFSRVPFLDQFLSSEIWAIARKRI